MMAYHWLSLIACACQLALASLVLGRSARDRMAMILGLLSLDLFAWNAADVAADFVAEPMFWNRVDHAAATLTTPLAFHFLLLFVGAARSYRRIIAASYAYFGALALGTLAFDLGGSLAWATLVLAVLLPEISLAIWLLLRRLEEARSHHERARTHLVLIAIVIGTLFGTSDLVRIMHAPIPRLSNVGTMASVLLLAVGALRFGLFERNVSRMQGVLAFAIGVTAIGAYLVAFARFGTNWAMLALSTTAVTLLLVLALRRFLGGLGEERSRIEYHAILGRFAHQMAHDLKNPLAAAKGAVQYLEQERSEGRSIDGQGEFLRLIDEQIERVLRVIAHYRRLGRVEAIREPTCINEVVEQVVASMRQTSRELDLSAKLDAGAPRCCADRDLLLSVIENLIKNSQEANGNVVVRTSASSRGARAGLTVSVEDDGCGMSPRVREQALDEFFTTKVEGNGLGLAFARRVAEAHEGDLSIESEEGRGTTVSIWLPTEVMP